MAVRAELNENSCKNNAKSLEQGCLTHQFTLFHLLKPKKHNLPTLCKMLIKGFNLLIISV